MNDTNGSTAFAAVVGAELIVVLLVFVGAAVLVKVEAIGIELFGFLP
jgi:hypothetical protein